MDAENRCIHMDTMPDVVVLVPTWNEATVIERRLDNLAAQRIEGHTLREAGVDLMVIDSASDDGTLEVAEAWLSSNPDAFANHVLLPMEERKGKTAACSGLGEHPRSLS